MKTLKTICFLSFCILFVNACKSDSTTSSQNATAQQAKGGHDHAGHDHAGHNHDHDHDHAGHDHDHDHDHAGHNHDHGKKETLSKEEMEERKAQHAKREKELKAPATAAQKATAEKLCACLNKIPSFAKVVGLTDQKAFDAAVGDNLEEVKSMQKCHNTIVTNDIKALPKDQQGVYAFKAREVANKSCLKTEDNKLWFLMGTYVTANTSAASKIQKTPRQNPLKKGN